MRRRGIGILAAKSVDVVLDELAKGEGCAGIGIIFDVVDAPGAALGDESDRELASGIFRGVFRRRQRKGDVGWQEQMGSKSMAGALPGPLALMSWRNNATNDEW
jgi:hypothetical protein